MQDKNTNNGTLNEKRPVSFHEKFSKEIVPKVYGFGATIVLIGAMFKLLSWPGGALMLGVGLSTEALIFFISAFEPPAKEYDWSMVFPQLDKDYAYEHGITDINKLQAPFINSSAVSSTTTVRANNDNLSELLESCKIDKASLDKLCNGIKNLSNLCAEMGDFNKANVNWDNLSAGLAKANESMTNVVLFSNNLSSSLGKINDCFNKFTETNGFISQIEEKTTDFNYGLSALSSKITELNKSYDNVIRALRG